jgi:hypothetical protein
MDHPLFLVVAIGVVLGLIVAVLATWRRYRLTSLFALIALAACLFGLVRVVVNASRYAAAEAAYGGRRYTREEAEAIRGENLDFLPDSEFLPTRRNSDKAATETHAGGAPLAEEG